jgi:hypothetical protein
MATNDRAGSKRTPIRLACMYCDTQECDGIDRFPDDWIEIDSVQSYEESCAKAFPSDSTRSVLDWYTHLGVCPDCQKFHG